jgi:hypothetical protein
MDLRETAFEDVDWIHLAQNLNQWWALGFCKRGPVSLLLSDCQLLKNDSAPWN